MNNDAIEATNISNCPNAWRHTHTADTIEPPAKEDGNWFGDWSHTKSISSMNDIVSNAITSIARRNEVYVDGACNQRQMICCLLWMVECHAVCVFVCVLCVCGKINSDENAPQRQFQITYSIFRKLLLGSDCAVCATSITTHSIQNTHRDSPRMPRIPKNHISDKHALITIIIKLNQKQTCDEVGHKKRKRFHENGEEMKTLTKRYPCTLSFTGWLFRQLMHPECRIPALDGSTLSNALLYAFGAKPVVH